MDVVFIKRFFHTRWYFLVISYVLVLVQSWMMC